MRSARTRFALVSFTFAFVATPAVVHAQGGGGGARPPSDRQGGDRGDRAERGPRGAFGGGGLGRMMGGGGDMMSPSVDSRELDQLNKDLGLTGEQKELARGLFEGYQEQFRARAQEWRDKMEQAREEARDSGDMRAAFQNMAPLFAELRTQRQKMEDQFFSDYKAVLTPEQQTKWPSMERDRRRAKTLNIGRLSGERVDLFKLVEQAKLPAEVTPKIAPILEQYASDLDRELVSRNKVYEEAFTRAPQAMGDTDQMQKMLERGREASVKVREVNRRYARQIEAVLPEEQKPLWEKALKEASFPDVYRETAAHRQIAAAAGFSDLDTAQQESLKALRETYARELDAANERLAKAQEASEMTVTAERLMRGGFGGGGDQDDPVSEARRQKRELDQRTSESLKKILTPEQAERLPANPRGGPGGGAAPGGGDGGERPRRRNQGGEQDVGGGRRPNGEGRGGGG
jgi:hypothetical protein